MNTTRLILPLTGFAVGIGFVASSPLPAASHSLPSGPNVEVS